MKTCVIHFGMNKTGSTSIQQSLAGQLDNPTWKYLDLGSSNHSAALSKIIPVNPDPREISLGKIDQAIFERRKRKKLPQLLHELETNAENLLISAEWLSSGCYELSELVAFRDLVAGYADKTILAGYIRPPKGYMESAFQEKLKQYNLRKLVIGQHYPHYKRKIERFDQVFGRENVLTWTFVPKNFMNGCVVQDFCSRLGIDFPIEAIKRVNESLSREAIAFLYTYIVNLKSLPEIPRSERSHRLLLEKLMSLNGKKMQFAWPMVLPVLAEHQADIAWMEERLGESLKESRQKLVAPVRFGKDLLKYTPESLAWLARELGAEYESRWHPDMEPKKVARWLHALRLKLAEQASIQATEKILI